MADKKNQKIPYLTRDYELGYEFLWIAWNFKRKKALFYLRLCECIHIQHSLEKSHSSWIKYKTVRNLPIAWDIQLESENFIVGVIDGESGF